MMTTFITCKYGFYWSIILLFIFGSCAKNDVVTVYFDDTNIISEVYHTNGRKLHGKYVSFSKSGGIRAKGVYRNGKMNGIWLYYYESGQIISEQLYDNGVLKNIEAWDENGDLVMHKGTGRYSLFFPSGKKMSEVSYKRCKPHGLWISWYEDGGKASEVRFCEGRIEHSKTWSRDSVYVADF